MSRSLRAFSGIWQAPSEPSPTRRVGHSLGLGRQETGERLLSESGLSAQEFLSGWIFGGSRIWKEWAQQRLFALSCATQMDLPESLLGTLRRSWSWYRLPLHTALLLKILRVYAGARAKPQFLLRASRCLPWAFAYLFERELKALRSAPTLKTRVARNAGANAEAKVRDSKAKWWKKGTALGSPSEGAGASSKA